MGVSEGQDPAFWMRAQPRSCDLFGGEEVRVPAEGMAHVPGPFEELQRDDRARRLEVADFLRAHAQAHRKAGSGARRGHPRGAAQKHGKDQRVEGAPGVEPLAADLDLMRGRPQRQSRPDDVAGIVELGGWDLGQDWRGVLLEKAERARDGRLRHGVPLGQQGEDGVEYASVPRRIERSVELLGQLVCRVHRVLPVRRIQASCQRSPEAGRALRSWMAAFWIPEWNARMALQPCDAASGLARELPGSGEWR